MLNFTHRSAKSTTRWFGVEVRAAFFGALALIAVGYFIGGFDITRKSSAPQTPPAASQPAAQAPAPAVAPPAVAPSAPAPLAQAPDGEPDKYVLFDSSVNQEVYLYEWVDGDRRKEALLCKIAPKLGNTRVRPARSLRGMLLVVKDASGNIIGKNDFDMITKYKTYRWIVGNVPDEKGQVIPLS